MSRDATPALVKSMAAAIINGGSTIKPSSSGTDMARRLLTDPKMNTVWTTLQRTPAKPWASEKWHQMKMLDEGASLQEMAAAVFFYSAMKAFGGLRLPPPPIWRRKEIEKMGAPWLSAAQLCWATMHRPPAESNVELAMALAQVGEYFEWKASVEREGSPIVIGRSSKDRGNDEVRVQVRIFASETHELFGLYLSKTLSTVATIALQTTITDKSVKNWCADLAKGGPIRRYSRWGANKTPF
jgi:hypothetical protein